jgi:hypothetical protein
VKPGLIGDPDLLDQGLHQQCAGLVDGHLRIELDADLHGLTSVEAIDGYALLQAEQWCRE